VGIPSRVRDVINRGPFLDDWTSLAAFRTPRWYEDGKFGIFVHWGPYSVPGFGNEWYPRNMYLPGSREFEHHRQVYGDQRDVGYKDLIERFSGERFDPIAWAGLFRESGAQFVVPVAEHHDGFAMYDSSRSEWTAVKRGPRRDVIGELSRAVRDQWMVFGLSSHRAEHWWFFNGGMSFPSDVADPRFASLYGPAQPVTVPPNEEFLEDWLLRTCEVVDLYRPQLVWFDWWIEQPAFEPYLRAFAAYYYNRGVEWGKEVAINYKYQAFREGTAVFDVERGQLGSISERFWQADTAILRNSWGYVKDPVYKPATSILEDMVDVVSKNGALLLNVGPAPDGTVPEGDVEVLRAVGAWLRVNGEAVYGARPWQRFGEGPTEVPAGSHRENERPPFTCEDVRFTVRTGAGSGGYGVQGGLYAIVLGRPGAGPGPIVLHVRSLARGIGGSPEIIREVRLLGAQQPAVFQHTSAGLEVQIDPSVLQALPAGPLVLKVSAT
jgi:alpha-L-fucosidase